jgi:hypothetical protein
VPLFAKEGLLINPSFIINIIGHIYKENPNNVNTRKASTRYVTRV